VVSVGASKDADVFGDAPNLAARVQEAAAPGTVVITEDRFQATTPGNTISLGSRAMSGICLTTWRPPHPNLRNRPARSSRAVAIKPHKTTSFSSTCAPDRRSGSCCGLGINPVGSVSDHNRALPIRQPNSKTGPFERPGFLFIPA
jgi:hypothetical protein